MDIEIEKRFVYIRVHSWLNLFSRNLQFQKIAEQSLARRSHYRFGVKLHALADEFAMPQPHHQPVRGRGGDFQHRRDAGAVDDQRVIAGGGEGVLTPSKTVRPSWSI